MLTSLGALLENITDSCSLRVLINSCFSKDKEILRVEKNFDFVSISRAEGCKQIFREVEQTYVIYRRLESLNIMV